MDEVRKQHDGIKKLYEQGLWGATASVVQVLDLFDTIEALQQENQQLQQELNDLKIYSLQMENGKIDMKVTGERAKLFMSALIQFFEQNGGKNFVTTARMVGKDRYEITVRKCGGMTPADKIEALEHEIEQLQEVLKQAREALKNVDVVRCPYCWGKETHSDKCEINKTITEIDKVLGGKDDGKTDI